MFKKQATFTAIFIGIFAGLFVAPALAIINAPNASAYQLSVSTSGDTIINLDNGQVKTKTSRVGVSTDCRAGYTWQIQGPADTNLYLSGDKTINESGKYLTPASSASALNSQPNTYGYNLTTNQTDQIFTPLASTAVTLKDFTDTASPSADINDTNNIHWGANAGMTLNAGTYILADNEAVTYIVTTSPTCVNYYNVSFDPNGGSGAQMPTQTITENTPTTLAKNTYTSSNDQDGFIGWNTQPDGSGTHYTDEQEVTLSGSDQNITLYAQWNCPASKICYFDNGASSPTTMDNQSATSNTATTLWPTNFQRKGYGFAGWAETTTPTTTDTIYGPQQTLTATEVGDLTTKGKKLYAVWIEAKDTIQNWTGCPKLTQATYSNGTVTANLSSVTALLDTRDGEAYAVAKLPDGKCWMIENLRLGSNTQIALTSANTAINSNLNFPAHTTDFSNPTNNYTTIRQNAINKLSPVAKMTGTNAQIFSYGVYYSWPAAIGSTGSYSSGSVSTSICPKGWTLPLGNSSAADSFGALSVALGGSSGTQTDASAALYNRWRSYPNNFIYSGGYFVSTSQFYDYRGTATLLWTRSVYNSNNSYTLNLATYSSTIYPGNNINRKYDAEPIRCIARSDYYTITFDKNGGAGTMPDQAIYRNTSTALNPATFTAPAGQFFNGWNTSPDGTGTSYTDEQNVNNLLAAGATITLYAQWGGCPANRVCYDENGANSPTKMGQQYLSNTTILWSRNYQRAGYGFIGWNTSPDGTGTMYGTNQIVTSATISTSGQVLYATWQQSAGDLQNWRGCGSMNIGDVTALTDTRDNNTYSVAKLADGNCWITENLRLGSDTPLTLTPSDSDVATNFTLPASSDPRQTAWCNTIDATCLDQPLQNSTATTDTVYYMTRANDATYGLGHAYNYYAATAGSRDSSVDSRGNAESSICPKGWHLPTGWNNGDMVALDIALGGNGTAQSGSIEYVNRYRAYPNNFPDGVRAGQGTLLFGGGTGDLWLSTSANNQAAFIFSTIHTGSISPGVASTNKYTGFSIRCLAEKNYIIEFDANGGAGDMADQKFIIGTPATLSTNTFTNSDYTFIEWNTASDGSGTGYPNGYNTASGEIASDGDTITLYAIWKKTLINYENLQDITSEICANTPLNMTATLKDTRDNKLYTVQKLADNKCWMTSNLRLGSSWADITLTPDSSDVSTNFTLPAGDDSQWLVSSAAFTDPAYVNVPKMYYGGDVWLSGNLNGASTMGVETSGTPDTESRYVGNYYNWYTATAGTGTLETIGNATNSICPKGWRLPTTMAADSDFVVLSSAYSDASEFKSSAPWILSGWFNSALSESRLKERGERGAWWTATATEIQFNRGPWVATTGTLLLTDGNTSKGLGLPMRCVARDSYTVKFDSNGGSGDMPNQIIYTDVATKLSANTFTNSPKSFVGWNTKDDGTGDSYTDEEAVADLVGKGETITLYAQWKYFNPLEQIGLMQEMTPAICDAASVGDTATLKDTRDNKTYQVAKLADNNCWMTQNLMLGNGEGGTTIELTDSDTDLIAGTTFTIPIHTPGVWASTSTDIAGINAAKMYNNGSLWVDPTSAGSNSTIKFEGGTPDNPSKYIGNYYNWYTATAGTGLYDTNTNAPSSICPKGWRLPTGGDTNNEFQALISALGASSNTAGSWVVQSSPNYFALSGHHNYFDGQIAFRGARGYWWSSTPNSTETYRAYNLILNPTGFNTNQPSVKAAGFSVRCLAR